MASDADVLGSSPSGYTKKPPPSRWRFFWCTVGKARTYGSCEQRTLRHFAERAPLAEYRQNPSGYFKYCQVGGGFLVYCWKGENPRFVRSVYDLQSKERSDGTLLFPLSRYIFYFTTPYSRNRILGCEKLTNSFLHKGKFSIKHLLLRKTYGIINSTKNQ